VIGSFERYAGLSLVPAAGLVLIYKFRNNIGHAIQWTFLFVVLTATPIFLWGYLHNYPINASVFGERIPYMPVVNLVSGSEKFLNWFIPTQVISGASPLFLYIVILCLLTLAIFWSGAAGLQSIINSPRVIPHLAFLIVYSGVLIFNITPELQGLETDRAHIILLPSLLIILLSVGSHVIKAARDKWGKIPVYLAATLLFLIWSVYPISKTYSYIERSMVNGDVSSYNSLNKVNIRSTAFSNYLSSLDVHDKQFYSNGEAAVWFILRVQVHSLPKSESSHRPTLTYLQQNYSGWPGAGNDGYLIWFNSYASKEYLATPDELGEIAIINEVYSDENGSVYSLKPQ
jgi:hypothetical protein